MALSLVWLRRVPLVNSRGVRWPKIFLGLAPIAQSAEAVDLKSIQCGFESHWGHHVKSLDVFLGSVVSMSPQHLCGSFTQNF